MLTYVYTPNVNIFGDVVEFAPRAEDFVKCTKRFYIFQNCKLFIVRRREDVLEFIPYSRDQVTYQECLKSFADALSKRDLAPIYLKDGVQLVIDCVQSEVIKVNDDVIESLFSRIPPMCGKDSDRVLFYYEDTYRKEQRLGTYMQNFGYSSVAFLEDINDWQIPRIMENPAPETLKWILDIVSATDYYSETPMRVVEKVLPFFKGSLSSVCETDQPTDRLKSILKLDELPTYPEYFEEIDEETDTGLVSKTPEKLPYAESLGDILEGFPLPEAGDILIDLPLDNNIIACYAMNNWLYFTVRFVPDTNILAKVNRPKLEEALGITNFSIQYLS